MKCGHCGADNAANSRFCGSCGEALEVPLSDGETLAAPVEILFGRYQVIEELGKGGMGRVVRVLDTSIQEEVALKLIRKRFVEDEAAVERFRNELKLARKIAHRNVCRMFDFAEAEETPYITMEYVRGESLRDLIDRAGGLAAEQLISLARGICHGLSEAHRLGVVHRDLKPQNIIIDEDGEPRILDFGIARSSATSGLTQLGSMIGTPEYMSPEQVEGAEVDGRSDIYSLGVILYEAAVGKAPFKGDSPISTALKQKTAPVPSLPATVSDIPPGIARIIVTCLQKRPQDRFQSVQEILDELGGREWRRPATPVAMTAELPTFLASDAGEPEAPERIVFAGRDAEMKQLETHFQSALAGKGRVVLISGEPGSGKSTLAGEFAARALGEQESLVVATGRCDAQTGSGDPYRPFRQILELLTGDVESRWNAGSLSREHASRLWQVAPLTFAALVEHGAGLLRALLPTEALLARAAHYGRQEWHGALEAMVGDASEPAANLQEAQLHEQYGKTLLSIARRRPLLLILDDLHWVDHGSASLLLQLGRHLADSPILIVGTSRAADLALGDEDQRHPLVAVRNELKRDFGSIEIELDQAEGREFLDAYLDAEPNSFADEFRDALFRQTGGHALFTVELLRSMIDRGLVSKGEDGTWQAEPDLDWQALPSRTEGVIGERVGRVSPELRGILDLASIEGEEFTAEVVARLSGADEREIVRKLSGELSKRHHLIEAIGIHRVNGRRLSQYRFRHILFRKFLYDQLDEVERAYHHEAVGLALEELWGSSAAEVAVHLAEHFEIAGDARKAADYHRQAGERAMRVGAIQAASEHLRSALDLIGTLPAGPERDRLELNVRLGMTMCLVASEGWGSDALDENYRRIGELCGVPEEADEGSQILYRLWGFHFIRSHQAETSDLAAQLGALAERSGDQLRLAADAALGITRFFAGDLAAAHEPLQRAAERFNAKEHGARLLSYGGDPALDSWYYSAWANILRGSLDQGWSILEEVTKCVEDLESPFSITQGLCFRAAIGADAGRDLEAILEDARASLSLSEEHDFPFWAAHASIWVGWASIATGEGEEGLAGIQQGLAMLDAIGTLVPYARSLTQLADACGTLGRVEEGLAAVDRALEISALGVDHHYDAESHRVKGELLLMQSRDRQAPEACFRQALSIAQDQGARLLELRAAISLARLLRGHGEKDAAAEVLAPVLAAFAGDFDSRHLREARELSEEPDQPRTRSG